MIGIDRWSVPPLCVLSAALWAGSALAAALTIHVPLSGSQGVPPVETTGTGMADLTYDPETRVVSWTITYSGLSGPAENAGVQIWLSKQGSPAENPIRGQATLTAEQAKDFSAGRWYVNVHTQAHPAGEIRGQVVPPKG